MCQILSQSLQHPSSHRAAAAEPLEMLVGINTGLRCWTPSAHQMFRLEMKCFSETHVDGLVLNVAVLRGDWI